MIRVVFLLSTFVSILSIVTFQADVISVAYAQEREQAFFSTLPDVPLMPGLYEVEDQAMGYDKAGGRILFGTARVDESLTREQVYAYYKRILPQFGWAQGGENRFIRKNEVLIFSVRDFEGQHFFEITISP